MIVERTHSRVETRTFQDFRVQVTVDDRYFAGELGNISETGLCVLVPGRITVRPGVRIRGTVQARHLAVHLEFVGRVAWTAEAVKAGRPCILLGVDFDREIELPPSVIALGMAAAQIDV